MWLDWFDSEDHPRHWVCNLLLIFNVDQITLACAQLSPHNMLLTWSHRINCRLPQTPRTPTAAAAHYSDSYFDETFSRSDKPRIRRSSTSRSIGNRSSFNNSTNGDVHAEADFDHNADPEQARLRMEANQHVANYINDQLERVRSNESVAVYEDEFEAQLDGI